MTTNNATTINRTDGWALYLPSGQIQFLKGISEAGAVREATLIGATHLRRYQQDGELRTILV